jgi:hypothetical protein
MDSTCLQTLVWFGKLNNEHIYATGNFTRVTQVCSSLDSLGLSWWTWYIRFHSDGENKIPFERFRHPERETHAHIDRPRGTLDLISTRTNYFWIFIILENIFTALGKPSRCWPFFAVESHLFMMKVEALCLGWAFCLVINFYLSVFFHLWWNKEAGNCSKLVAPT